MSQVLRSYALIGCRNRLGVCSDLHESGRVQTAEFLVQSRTFRVWMFVYVYNEDSLTGQRGY